MKVAVVGGGAAGMLAAIYSARNGNETVILEQNEKLGKKLGYRCTIVDDKNCSVLPRADLIVTSPGVFPQKSALYRQAVDSGTELIGELEFASRHFSGQMLAIPVTNGKTTTTELTVFLLNELGHPAFPAGNIGIPLSEHCAENTQGIAVIEVSSFQLERAPGFAPDAAVLLNLASDHEDRYPGGFEEYCAVKRSIFNRVKPENRISGLSFDREIHRVYPESDHLMIDGTPVVKLSETALSAPHNVENLAAATELLLRILPEAELMSPDFAEAVKKFVPGKHRIERVAEKNSILFINDSKATNPAAVLAAVSAFDRKTVILLGGLDKGMDFTPLAQLKPKLRGAVLYGESGEKIGRILHDVPQIFCGKNFDLAFSSAVSMAQPGDCVLLSPACASMDMFKNYQERGNRFRELVEKLP